MTNIDSKKNLANTTLLSTTEPKTVLKVIRSDEHEKKSLRNKFIERISKNCLTKKDYLVIATTFVIMLTSILFLFIYKNEFLQWHSTKLSTWWGVIIYSLGLALLILKTSFLFYLGYLFIKYKPVKNVADADLPTCTIIVPAYNEGKLVYDNPLGVII